MTKKKRTCSAGWTGSCFKGEWNCFYFLQFTA